MSERTAINPGKVAWSGDNPGIYLKDDPEGDWRSLAVFFRVVCSPHGRGHAMVVLEAPDEAKGYPEVRNLCVTDNEPLLAYLIEDYLSKFPSFSGRPGLAAMTHLPLERVETLGDLAGEYSEVVASGEVTLAMTWKQMGEPFFVEVGPEKSATGAHDMYSLFLEAKDAEITVNGAALAGRVADRVFFGRPMSTAFLAFSETWVTPR